MSVHVSLQSLSKEQREEISEDLVIKENDNKYNMKKKEITLFDIDDNNICSLPFSYWFFRSEDFPNTINYDDGKEHIFSRLEEHKFEGKLNFIQEQVKKEAFAILNETHSILISLFCGAGKTAFAIFLCSLLRYKGCILSHRVNIIYQWIYSFRKFLPSVTVQILTAKNVMSNIAAGPCFGVIILIIYIYQQSVAKT